MAFYENTNSIQIGFDDIYEQYNEEFSKEFCSKVFKLFGETNRSARAKKNFTEILDNVFDMGLTEEESLEEIIKQLRKTFSIA